MIAGDDTLSRLRAALIGEDVCPECLGALDEGWQCDCCGYDAVEEVANDWEG